MTPPVRAARAAVCEMIFISVDLRRFRVFYALQFKPPVGALMNKSGTLIVTALLSLGLAAGAMAGEVSKAAAPVAADAPAAASSSAPKSTTKKHSTKKTSKKKKKAAAPATAK
jgi:hypothetical protein